MKLQLFIFIALQERAKMLKLFKTINLVSYALHKLLLSIAKLIYTDTHNNNHKIASFRYCLAHLLTFAHLIEESESKKDETK